MVGYMIHLDDYLDVVKAEEIEAIKQLGIRLAGRTVQHINSTAVGGGVAEILKRLVPLMQEVGIKARWNVISGSEKFFQVTKIFHNAFHGLPVRIIPEMMTIYQEELKQNFRLVNPGADFIILHDQQPLGLAEARRNNHPVRWVWYCHIDPTGVSREVWDFLRPYAQRCDAAIYHLPDYAKKLGNREYFMPPAIDPLAEKNREVIMEEKAFILEQLEIPTDLPLIVQVSRFDRLKDPLGVVKTFRLIRKEMPCRLILAGGMADDDPEGTQILFEIQQEAGNDPDIHLLVLPPVSDLAINVIQRVAAVIIQKSVQEGFGLTVSEALWKARPVVATPVGGIKLQVLPEKTGLLARTNEEMAAAVVRLLRNPDFAEQLGKAGHEHVRQNFILPIYLKRWLEVLNAELL